MHKPKYHLGHIPALDLKQIWGSLKQLLLLHIMGNVIIYAMGHERMANSVIESRVMRLSHGIELVNLDTLDLLKVGDHQLVAHHLLIS